MRQKARKKKHRRRKFIKFLMIAGIAYFAYRSIITSGNSQIFEKLYAYAYKTVMVPLPIEKETDVPVSVTPDQLYSSNAILVRLRDDAVLMEKNSEEKVYPASLTKMMTVFVAIEHLSDLNEKIELTQSMFEGLYEANASMAGFKPGEQVRSVDLLYGAMLPSGAESCIALAEHIAGSEQNFVRLMNEKAEELGMCHTHFENTTGLHDENHYTTVKDMSIFLREALQNDIFRDIFTTFRYSTPPTNQHPEGITLTSTMYEKLDSRPIMNGEILGGKTGYTDEAGLCLASLAKVGQQEYILITAGAKGNHHTEQFNITDALAVYNSLGEI